MSKLMEKIEAKLAPIRDAATDPATKMILAAALIIVDGEIATHEVELERNAATPIKSGDVASRGCAKCNKSTSHIVVRGSGSGGGSKMTYHLEWRCTECKERTSTNVTEDAKY